jgi:hypothetical protein
MKTYRNDVKTTREVTGPDGKPMDQRVVVALHQYQGPETAEEFATWTAKSFTVETFVLTPELVIGDNGVDEGVLTAAPKRAGTTTEVSNFDAWVYGASLKANGLARKAADEGLVKDHKINFAGKVTDLDAIQGVDLTVRSINALVNMGVAGIEIGPRNVNVLNAKIAQLVAAGMIVKNADGTVAAKKNGAAVKK